MSTPPSKLNRSVVSGFSVLRYASVSLFLGSALLGFARRSYAATTRIVTSNFDSGIGTLRNAIAAADPGDTIKFQNNLQSPIVLSSELPINKDLTITGPGSNLLSISGSDNSRIFNVDDGNAAASANVVISGLTLTHGKAPASAGGGAIYNAENLSLTDCVISFSSSAAAFDGGGILSINSLSLSKCTISQCTQSGTGKGGAIASTAANLILTNCTLSQNTSFGKGGGISMAQGVLTLSNSTLSGNAALDRGGGAFLYQSTNTITNTSIVNGAANSRGGGLDLYQATTTLDQCTISGNTSKGTGGGGVHLYKGTATVTNTTISGNSGTVGRGGGLFLYKSTSTFKNCTISGNSAPLDGGNVYITDATTVATIKNSTVTKGSTGGATGGGISRAAGTLSAVSTIVAGNVTGDAAAGTINGTDDHNLVGGDPKLAPLANNAGPTLTHALLPGSPALQAGVNPDGLQTDQRGVGYNRLIGSGVDLGAFEVQAPIITAASFTPLHPTPGDAVTFNISTVPSPGFSSGLAYDYGDGTADTLGVHAYAAPGTYTVVATITDGISTLTQKFSILVTQQPAIISSTFAPPRPINTDTVVFTLGTSVSPGQTAVTTYDYGDGTVDTLGAHVFINPGTYNVKVTVSDAFHSTTQIIPVVVSLPVKTTVLTAKLNFAKPKSDAVMFVGTIQTPSDVTTYVGKTITIDIGGALSTFTILPSLHAKSGGATLAIAAARNLATFTFIASKSDFRTALLASADLENVTVPSIVRTIPVGIFDGETHYFANVNVNYTAKHNVSGTAIKPK
ncbi:MAG TPA: choice-of-anchor Q domain-containing protein [Planctomycetota bacterium]|nr:choice-of-anchor Q domain-containing protein [Planctomycetota bacterium]